MALIPFPRSRTRRFDESVRPHLEAMYRFAYRLTGQRHDAEDLVQDVVVKLYPRLEELEAVERPGPWLNRVLYRQFVDNTRKRARRSDRPFSDFGDPAELQEWMEGEADAATNPEVQVAEAQLRPAIRELLSTLPPDHRTLLLLHDVDNWRLEELSDVLDMPVGTLKSRLHRIRAALRKKISASGEPIRPCRRHVREAADYAAGEARNE